MSNVAASSIKEVCNLAMESSPLRRLTKGDVIQVKNIYGEGDAVYAKDEGNGTLMLYVEEVKNGIYILRRSGTKEKDVIRDKEFCEADLSETPWMSSADNIQS